MKALSLTQPWATLLAIGEKKIETRSWPTRFRGTFAIHAAKGFPRWARDLVHDDAVFKRVLSAYGYTSSTTLPTGAIIGLADLTCCLPTSGGFYSFEARDITLKDGKVVSSHVEKVDYRQPDLDSNEYYFGDYNEGRYMFFTENARPVEEPIPCKGALGFWEVPADIAARIEG